MFIRSDVLRAVLHVTVTKWAQWTAADRAGTTPSPTAVCTVCSHPFFVSKICCYLVRNYGPRYARDNRSYCCELAAR